MKDSLWEFRDLFRQESCSFVSAEYCVVFMEVKIYGVCFNGESLADS
jgi:hypothetical protein